MIPCSSVLKIQTKYDAIAVDRGALAYDSTGTVIGCRELISDLYKDEDTYEKRNEIRAYLNGVVRTGSNIREGEAGGEVDGILLSKTCGNGK